VFERYLGLPLVDTVSSQVPEFSTEPDSFDCTAEYTGRIADLEDRLKTLKQRTIIAMGQAKKYVALFQKVSSLE
jgi:hypothetical protein